MDIYERTKLIYARQYNLNINDLDFWNKLNSSVKKEYEEYVEPEGEYCPHCGQLIDFGTDDD